MTITITALFDDSVTDEQIASIATDAFVQVQEPEIDGSRVPSPTRFQTRVIINDETLFRTEPD